MLLILGAPCIRSEWPDDDEDDPGEGDGRAGGEDGAVPEPEDDEDLLVDHVEREDAYALEVGHAAVRGALAEGAHRHLRVPHSGRNFSANLAILGLMRAGAHVHLWEDLLQRSRDVAAATVHQQVHAHELHEVVAKLHKKRNKQTALQDVPNRKKN